MGFKKRFLTLLIISLTAAASYGQSWFNLGYGSHALKANDRIATICTDTFNNVYAAGYFTDSTNSFMGPEGYQYVAKWDVFTHNWSELGTGSNRLKANQSINSICTDKKGNVYAAGSFTNGVSKFSGYMYVSKWDGIRWTELGTGSNALKANGIIKTICADDSGNIYAAGNFYNTSGYPYVAKWDGTKWQEVGNLFANDFINSICVDDSNNIYAAGNFTDASGHPYVAKYNPITHAWSELGTGFDSGTGVEVEIASMVVDSMNNVYAAVNFYHTSSGDISCNIFKWNGTNWNQLGTLNGNSWVESIAKGNDGRLYAGGNFDNLWGKKYVAVYDPATDAWSELGGNNAFNPHTNQPSVFINSICVDNHNYVYAGGNFMNSGNFFYIASYGKPYLTLEEINSPGQTVKIYPNPVAHELNIIVPKLSIPNKTTYSIYDPTGNILTHGELDFSGYKKINVKDFPSGIYIIKLSCSQILFKFEKIQ